MQEMIQLPPRLAAAAERVPAGKRLADVGTDHAKLPVCLVQRGIVPNAIASDIRKGPLERAAAAVRRAGLTDRIELRLCPGLEKLTADEIDVITICGMGGETIRQILEAAPWAKDKLLILQPQSVQADLRLWLAGNGWRITEESIVREDGFRWYSILTVTGGAAETPSALEAWTGMLSCRTGPEEDWKAYTQTVLRKMRIEYEFLKDSEQPKDLERKQVYEAVFEEADERGY